MLRNIIYPLSKAIFSNRIHKTIYNWGFQSKRLNLANYIIYNYSKTTKKNTLKPTSHISAQQQIKQLYQKLGWSSNFKQQYTKLSGKYTSNGDMPSLIKLKQFRTIKDQQHNDQNNQSHLLQLYQLAALYEAENKPNKTEFYFKKVHSLLKKFPGLTQTNQLNQIIQYMIGKHLFAQSIQHRKQAKQWYQLFKQKLDNENTSYINNDLRFYYHFELAVIYLDMKMFEQSHQQFKKFCDVLNKGGLQQIDKNVILVALYEFAEVEFEKGDKNHALKVVDVLLSRIDNKNKDQLQYLDKSQQLIDQFGKQLQQSKLTLQKIKNLKNNFSSASDNKPTPTPKPEKKPSKTPIIPNIKQVQSLWNNFSQDYNKFDYCPQTLYYSFLYMLQVWQGKNILQIACGTGKLLPMAVNMKDKSANYLAVDLSPQMIELTHKNLKRNLQLYNSKLTYQEWLRNHNIQIMVANGEQPLNKPPKFDKKFDRIICNCCLMLTENAEKMLKNLSQQAEKGCLLGVSVWGNKDNNNLMTSIRQSYLEAKVSLPEQRSNFHLYKKVSTLAQKCGWQTVLSWQQNALFPALSANSQKYKSFFFHQVEKVQQSKKQQVKKILLKKLARYFQQQKKGLNFSCEMFILRKK